MENIVFSGKFIIAPCSGVGQTFGTISRQAAYIIVDELAPNETLLLCLPAFVTNIEEDVRMVEGNPTRIIVIDGCNHRCMSRILEERGYKPAETIVVSRIIREMGLKIDKKRNRKRLGPEEEKVVSEVANRAIEAIRRVKGGAKNLH